MRSAGSSRTPEEEDDWGGGPSPEAIEAAGRQLIALVAARLPERFYVNGEPMWRLAATALAARMAGLVESVLCLLPERRPSDTAILVRALYEYAVTACWLLIDPTERQYEYAGAAWRARATLHRDALSYGLELLSDEELDKYMAMDHLPPLAQRARQVDEHYGGRLKGFRAPGATGGAGLLTFEGLYVGLYRITSRSQHASVEALEACVDPSRYPWRVQFERSEERLWSSIAVPLFALALLAVSDRLGWPDPEDVRRINDEMHTPSDSEH